MRCFKHGSSSLWEFKLSGHVHINKCKTLKEKLSTYMIVCPAAATVHNPVTSSPPLHRHTQMTANERDILNQAGVIDVVS